MGEPVYLSCSSIDEAVPTVMAYFYPAGFLSKDSAGFVKARYDSQVLLKQKLEQCFSTGTTCVVSLNTGRLGYLVFTPVLHCSSNVKSSG